MSTGNKLSFRQMLNLSFGFFGVQVAYALQSANISRVFATLGADPHQLSLFWILPPLMGMFVQPLIGKWSDRTWCRLGRRKPYLLGGALVAVAVMALLPNAGSLHFDTRVFLGLNSAMWFGLFALMFLDTSINVSMQPFKMMVGEMVRPEQKTTAYSIQSFLCNSGSLTGFLLPIGLTWIGIANTAPKGVVPPSVVYSFYLGAAILILCVLYTFLNVREMPPAEYAAFHGISEKPEGERGGEGLLKLLVKAPGAFWTVGLVQFCCWAAFLYMWTYSTGAVAGNVWHTHDSSTPEYQTAGNWVGLMYAVQSAGSIIWALVLTRFRKPKRAYVISLLTGAVGFISIFFIHDKFLLLGSFLLIGATWAATMALPFALLTTALEGSPYMGSYLGLFNCTICLPQIVAATTGGFVIRLFGGSQPMMLVLAGCFLLVGAFCVRFISVDRD